MSADCIAEAAVKPASVHFYWSRLRSGLPRDAEFVAPVPDCAISCIMMLS
jgi:hypothetical protein